MERGGLVVSWAELARTWLKIYTLSLARQLDPKGRAWVRLRARSGQNLFFRFLIF